MTWIAAYEEWQGRGVARPNLSRAGRTEQIRELAAQGLTLGEIAAQLGMDYAYISRLAKTAGIAVRRKNQGPRHPGRAADILARRNAGETLESIAASHGLTDERVRQICKRLGARSGADIIESRRVTWTCEICGTATRYAPHEVPKRNSHKRCEVLARGEIIVKRRIAGAAWTDIGLDLHGYRRMPGGQHIRAAKLYLTTHNASPDIWAKVFPGRGHTNDPERRCRRMSEATRRRHSGAPA